MTDTDGVDTNGGWDGVWREADVEALVAEMRSRGSAVPAVVPEAIELLGTAGITGGDLAREMRLEPSELEPLLADPIAMRPLHQMRLAKVLENHAARTRDPVLSDHVTRFLWTVGLNDFKRRHAAKTVDVMAGDPARAEAELAAFFLEELGPEIFEHMPIPPGTPDR